MTSNIADQKHFSDAKAASVACSCFAYGVLGIVVAAPLLAVSLVGLATPVIDHEHTPPLLPALTLTAFTAFAVWTFSLRLIAEFRLVSVSRCIRSDPNLARTRFLQAYRVAKTGGIFSLIPFLAITGSWGIVFLGTGLIAEDFGLDTGSPIYRITLVLSVLAVGYYVVFFRLRKMRDRWFSDAPTSD